MPHPPCELAVASWLVSGIKQELPGIQPPSDSVLHAVVRTCSSRSVWSSFSVPNWVRLERA